MPHSPEMTLAETGVEQNPQSAYIPIDRYRNRVQSRSPTMLHQFLKPLVLVSLVLILPVVILVFAGEAFASVIESWKSSPPAPITMFFAIAGILATDVFLPVPSGPISTLAGSQLGIVFGTLASTFGMTIGGVIAFALARKWGRPFAERFSSPQELTDMETIADSFGLSALLLTRPLPIVAEACVLLLGTLKMHWRVFLPALVGSNLLIAATYATLGHYASEQAWLPTAVGMSLAVPVLLTILFRRFGRMRSQSDKNP
jgi:uncharacterized membrane protein YdjX (TVP38/TMEM64 family)